MFDCKILEKLHTIQIHRFTKASLVFRKVRQEFNTMIDNMSLNISSVVLRPFNFCIVDEVDSVLIDEAQTPLIISNQVETCVDKYVIASEITEYLDVNVHFKVDEKNKNVIKHS